MVIAARSAARCRSEEEKSDEFGGTRTEPTTLPAASATISLVSLLFEPVWRA
jgi:hypothetical protein